MFNTCKASYKVDGLSGATITSRGVSNMVEYWFGESGYSMLVARTDSLGAGLTARLAITNEEESL